MNPITEIVFYKDDKHLECVPGDTFLFRVPDEVDITSVTVLPGDKIDLTMFGFGCCGVYKVIARTFVYVEQCGCFVRCEVEEMTE